MLQQLLQPTSTNLPPSGQSVVISWWSRLFILLRLRNSQSHQLFPYDVQLVRERGGEWKLEKATVLVFRGDWTAAATGRDRESEKAVRPEGGGDWRGRGMDCTTWMRHCSTCLLISSSLPANGALHSGHTWPPSSGFLLFILPIRAGEKRQAHRRQTTGLILSVLQHNDTFVNSSTRYKKTSLHQCFLTIINVSIASTHPLNRSSTP